MNHINYLIVALVIAMTLIATGSFTAGQYVGKLQALNTMYKVELEKAQQVISGDMKIMKAYKEGQK